uniref:Uncharacterized protein n=1 Tax=Romanomermis culicivorax TaxID=13658 RepID=A0A915K5W7_ROMCU
MYQLIGIPAIKFWTTQFFCSAKKIIDSQITLFRYQCVGKKIHHSDLTGKWKCIITTRMVSDDRCLPLLKIYPTMISRFPIAWVNVTRQESLEDNSRSIQNVREAGAIVHLVAKNEDIVIITSYSTQIAVKFILSSFVIPKSGNFYLNSVNL